MVLPRLVFSATRCWHNFMDVWCLLFRESRKNGAWMMIICSWNATCLKANYKLGQVRKGNINIQTRNVLPNAPTISVPIFSIFSLTHFFSSNHVILFVVHQIMAITMVITDLVISHHGPSSPSIGPRRFQASTTEATHHHCPVFGRPGGLLLGTVDRAPPWRQLQQTIARADHGGNGLCLGSFDLFVLNTGWKGGQRLSKVETKKKKRFQKISD